MKRLSVVIAAGSGPGPVLRCLESLEIAGARAPCEVIVVSPAKCHAPAWVRTVAAAAGDSYPALRAAGMAAAHTPLVATLSEDYTVDAAWLERALEAGEADVTGGLTQPPAGASLAARAAWLWEYAHLAPPMADRELARNEAVLIPAGNAVYRRERVDPAVLRSAGSELDYHAELHDAGLTFRRDARLAAVYNPPGFKQFMRDRARWSAMWASSRSRGMGLAGRWIAAASRVLLPAALLGRLAARIAGKPRYWLSCVAALPLFAAFACAQAYGEARAYLDHG